MRHVQGYEVELTNGRRQTVGDLDTLRELVIAGTIDGKAWVVTPSGQRTTVAAALGVATARSVSDTQMFEGVYCLACRALIPPRTYPCPVCHEDPTVPRAKQGVEPTATQLGVAQSARRSQRAASNRRRLNSLQIVAVVLGCFVLCAIFTPFAERTLRFLVAADAYQAATSFARDRLKAPYTAHFVEQSESDVLQKEDGGWIVHTAVDSQNGFGAMLRSKVDVELHKTPGSSVWILDNIKFSDPTE